jgi:hypothetical protein
MTVYKKLEPLGWEWLCCPTAEVVGGVRMVIIGQSIAVFNPHIHARNQTLGTPASLRGR